MKRSEMAKQRRILADSFICASGNGAFGTPRLGAAPNGWAGAPNFWGFELLNPTVACAEYQLTSISIVSNEVTLA